MRLPVISGLALAASILAAPPVQAQSTRTTYTVTYAYDALGRLSQVAHDDASSYTYTYDRNGHLTTVETVEEGSRVGTPPDETLPRTFALRANYPNPFNPSTAIAYQIPQATHVRLTVFNALGQRVTTLVDAEQAPGYYSVAWDARSHAGLPVASGLYFYRLEAGAFQDTRSMLLVK